MTNWTIDIRGAGELLPNTQDTKDKEKKISLISIKGIGKKTVEILTAANYSGDKLVNASIEELSKVPGIGKKTAEKIISNLSKHF